MRLGFILLLLPLCLHPYARGQAKDTSSVTGSDTARVDSARRTSPFVSLSGDTLRSLRPRKNPWLAVGLSAALPGAGQIYNQSYWKPPIIWGFAGYWIYEWFQNNSSYKDYRDKYSASIPLYPPYGDLHLQNLRDFYRDERDKFAWYLGALYFLNLVDAYVSASLFDFDVSSDLGMRGPALPPGITATIRLRF